MNETVLTNAKLVLEDETVGGTLVFDENGIRAIDQSRSQLGCAIDADGDYVSPGLIEMHTDNLEKHFVPRPGVFWPDGLAAAMAHDWELAGAGITSVYDSICAGTPYGVKDYRRSIFAETMEAIGTGVARGLFRISHLIHIRCELSGDNLLDDVMPYIDHPLVKLASLMDHTPGQRQWRNVEDLKRYEQNNSAETDAEFEAGVRKRMETGPLNVSRSLSRMAALLAERTIPIATHDDTTEQDVRAASALGAVISEFPTTVEAASLAHRMGMATVAGAPNVVRGGSHSGGVSAVLLAEKGVLDGLSSDYVPASLLQSVLKLTHDIDMPLHQGMAMATWKVAEMVRLPDRGQLKCGLRADILRFRAVGHTPHVRGLWSNGRRVL